MRKISDIKQQENTNSQKRLPKKKKKLPEAYFISLRIQIISYLQRYPNIPMQLAFLKLLYEENFRYKTRGKHKLPEAYFISLHFSSTFPSSK